MEQDPNLYVPYRPPAGHYDPRTGAFTSAGHAPPFGAVPAGYEVGVVPGGPGAVHPHPPSVPPPGASRSPDHPVAETAGEPPASFGRRAVAFVFDLIVASILAGLLGSVMAAGDALSSGGFSPEAWEDAPLTAEHATSTLTPLLLLAYFAFFTAYGGRTPGMMGMGLRVADARGRTPGPGRALWRAFCYITGPLTWGLAYLMALGPERKALHDRLSGTRVLRSPLSRSG